MYFVHFILLTYCTVKYTGTDKPKHINVSVATTFLTNFVTTSTLSLEEESVDVNITTETPLTTTCEDNSTCFVPTVEPNINGSSTRVNVTNITKKNKGKHYWSNAISSAKELCTCNLQLGICDINCCCDPDCSQYDKLIFRRCESENYYYDTRYCNYIKHIYVNNTLLQWHVNQNGLFCVLKSNLPPSYIIQRKQPLSSFNQAEQERVNKFSWPQGLRRTEVKLNVSENFIYGNNVWIVDKNNIKKFQVPKKYFSNTCITKEHILNLKNIKNVCYQTNINEENGDLHFRKYFQNITVVANPILLNTSKYKNIQECPKNVCLPIFPKICGPNFSNCQNIGRNDSRLDFKCFFEIRNNKNNCKNALKALQYNLYHNGTQGYTKVELLGVLEDFSYEFGLQDYRFAQEFRVNFWWINQSRNFSAMLSGNPGYLTGKPILTGNLVYTGNSTNFTVKIERYSEDYSRNFLVLPDNVNGKCALNNLSYVPIEFNYNLLTKCELSTTFFNKKKYLNATEICRELQNRILKMLGVTGHNKTVGAFGNANANIPEEWNKIMYSSSLEEILNKTTGLFKLSNTSLTCFGLVSCLVINIYHSKIDFKTSLNQEKILGVTFSFEEVVNKTISYDKKKNSTQLVLGLESRVVFYDITVQKKKAFVDRPSLEIRLPYDFFYPFIKIDSSVKALSPNVIFCINVFLIMLFIK